MTRVFIAKIKDKKLEWNSDQHRAMFMEFLGSNDGKELRIELSKNPVSDNMRAYYFGALIPTVKSVVPEWRENTNDEVHEALRKMFNYVEMFNPITKRNERFGMSIMGDSSNTRRGMEVIEKIGVWLGEEYSQELPDPEEYKKLLNSAQLK